MFDFLPTVDNCCMCCNLKIGAILIAICGIIAFGSMGYVTQFPICEDSADKMMTDVVKYFGYAALASNALLTITSLIFLICACMERFEIAAILFLIAILLFILLNIGCLVVIVVAIATNPDCRNNMGFHSTAIILPLWIYFMIVVRSFKDEMSG